MQFQDRYKYNPHIDLLGKGGFARVYRATDTLLDRVVAVKVFNVADSGHYTVLEEIKKVIRYEHPNLLRYYDVAILENTNAFGENEVLQVGIMEYANGGDLKTFAQKNPNSPLLYKLLQQVLSGLGFLHNKGIIHRDLKPQNILLTEENGTFTAKISDFGISRHIDTNTNSASMTIGTIEYMAPEQFSPNKYGIEGKVSTNVDLWSFGIMVHELIADVPPFGHRGGDTTAEQIMSSILSADLPKEVDDIREPYQSVIKKCLVADAKQRIKTATELISYFEGAVQSPPVQTNSGNQINLETQVLNNFLDLQVGEGAEIPKVVGSENETQVLESNNRFPNDIPTPSPENELQQEQVSDIEVYSKFNLIIITLACLFLFFAFPFVGSHLFKGSVIAVFLTSILALGALFGVFFFAATFVFKYWIKPSGRTNKYSMITAIVIFLISGIFSFKYYFPNFGTTDQSVYSSVDQWYKEKKYDLILRTLKDSVNLQLASISVKAVNHYTLAMLGKGDTLAAIPYLTKSVESGSTDFTYLLGELYFSGKYLTKNYAKAKQYFEALPNDSRAQTMLGNIYLMGLGVDMNYEKAIPYYKQAAGNGNSVAMYSLGLAYFNGAGVKKNLQEAKKWFDAVVQKNDNIEAVRSAKTELEKISFYGVWNTADWQIEFAAEKIRLVNKSKKQTYIGSWKVSGNSFSATYAGKGTDSLTWNAKIIEFSKDKLVLQDKEGKNVFRKVL